MSNDYFGSGDFSIYALGKLYRHAKQHHPDVSPPADTRLLWYEGTEDGRLIGFFTYHPGQKSNWQQRTAYGWKIWALMSPIARMSYQIGCVCQQLRQARTLFEHASWWYRAAYDDRDSYNREIIGDGTTDEDGDPDDGDDERDYPEWSDAVDNNFFGAEDACTTAELRLRIAMARYCETQPNDRSVLREHLIAVGEHAAEWLADVGSRRGGAENVAVPEDRPRLRPAALFRRLDIG